MRFFLLLMLNCFCCFCCYCCCCHDVVIVVIVVIVVFVVVIVVVVIVVVVIAVIGVIVVIVVIVVFTLDDHDDADFCLIFEQMSVYIATATAVAVGGVALYNHNTRAKPLHAATAPEVYDLGLKPHISIHNDVILGTFYDCAITLVGCQGAILF